jgi:sugar (pentulose or hexulose) kinase
LGYEVLVKIGAKVGKNIYTGGGGVKSPLWLQIRADVLEKTLIKPKFPDASLGCAILAASRTYYNSLVEAAQAMAQLDQPVIPDLKTTDRYQEKYLHFKEEMVKRGYLRN